MEKYKCRRRWEGGKRGLLLVTKGRHGEFFKPYGSP
jgi:hypothetical protein